MIRLAHRSPTNGHAALVDAFSRILEPPGHNYEIICAYRNSGIPILKASWLIFVRLAHGGRFFGALVIFALVLFVFFVASPIRSLRPLAQSVWQEYRVLSISHSLD